MQFIFNKRGGDDTQPLGVKGCSWESGHQLHGCFISPAGPELCKGTVAWVWNRKTQNKEENGEWLNKLKTVSLKTDNISNKFEMQYFGNSNGNWILKATLFILINGLGTKSLVLRTKHMTKNMGHLSCLGDVVALWPSGPSLLGQRSRVRIRHLPQWSWCAAGSLCNNVENLRGREGNQLLRQKKSFRYFHILKAKINLWG